MWKRIDGHAKYVITRLTGERTMMKLAILRFVRGLKNVMHAGHKR